MYCIVHAVHCIDAREKIMHVPLFFSDFRIPNGYVSNQYQIESSLFTSSTSASTSAGTPTPSTSVGTPSVPSISKYFFKPLNLSIEYSHYINVLVGG